MSYVSVSLTSRASLFASFAHHIILGSISGLASQVTARQGNALGILGVSSGILASLAAVGFPVEVLAQFVGVAGIGGIIGKSDATQHTTTLCKQSRMMN